MQQNDIFYNENDKIIFKKISTLFYTLEIGNLKKFNESKHYITKRILQKRYIFEDILKIYSDRKQTFKNYFVHKISLSFKHQTKRMIEYIDDNSLNSNKINKFIISFDNFNNSFKSQYVIDRKKETFLFFSADLKGDIYNDICLEKELIENEIVNAGIYNFISFTQLKAHMLDEYLKTCTPNSIHFACHGNYTSLILADDSGEDEKSLTNIELTSIILNYIGLGNPKLNLIYLNSCNSFNISECLCFYKVCTFSIGTLKEIGSKYAVDFAQMFYSEFSNGKTVPESYNKIITITNQFYEEKYCDNYNIAA